MQYEVKRRTRLRVRRAEDFDGGPTARRGPSSGLGAGQWPHSQGHACSAPMRQLAMLQSTPSVLGTQAENMADMSRKARARNQYAGTVEAPQRQPRATTRSRTTLH